MPTMSARVEKGKRWFKFVLLLVGISAGIKVLFALGHPNMGNKLALAFVQFVGGALIFGSLAFLLGWLAGKEKEPASRSDGASTRTPNADAGTSNAQKPPQDRNFRENAAVGTNRDVVDSRAMEVLGKDDTQPPATLSSSVSSSSSLTSPTISQLVGSESTLTADTSSTAGHDNAGNDEEFFALALRELESNRAVEGLWAKCFAEADGNDNKAKARYLRSRAAQFKSEHEVRAQREAARVIEEAACAAAAAKVKLATEAGRRKLVQDGQVAHATLDECCALLAEAGYCVERTEEAYLVTFPKDASPEKALKGLAELRLFVDQNIAFSQAPQEECIAAFKKLGCAVVLKSNGLFSVTLPSGANRMLGSTNELRTLLMKATTKGLCPNCNAEIALNSQCCQKCNALFVDSATWKIKPL